jgi:hydrogenase maturation factor HypF (carbamoyltransferase family)
MTWLHGLPVCLLFGLASCSKAWVRAYDGPPRPRAEVALVTVDARESTGVGASWGGRILRVDGKDVAVTADTGVVEVLPGCHAITASYRVDFSRVARKAKTIAPQQPVVLVTKKNLDSIEPTFRAARALRAQAGRLREGRAVGA